MMKKTSDKSNLIKVNAATAIAVLAMHVGIAAALVQLQGPKPVIKEPEEVKPIEIQMLSMQEAVEPPTAAQTKPNTPQVTQEQVTKVQSQPKPASKPTKSVKPEPEIQPKPKPVEKNEPEPIQKAQSKSEAKVEAKTAEPLNNQQTSQQTIHQDVQPEVSTKPNFDANEHQRLIEQAAREQAAREQAAREQAAREQAAREQAAREQAAREQAAREQAAREQAAREQAAREQAAREQAAREQAAREQAAREQAAREAAASNEPKSFSANQARWKRKPRLEVPPQVARKSNSGDVYLVILAVTVDKQGNVADVKVTKSSGNTAVDKAAISQVKKSKLHPFEQDKSPVVGLINLPIEYIVE